MCTMKRVIIMTAMLFLITLAMENDNFAFSPHSKVLEKLRKFETKGSTNNEEFKSKPNTNYTPNDEICFMENTFTETKEEIEESNKTLNFFQPPNTSLVKKYTIFENKKDKNECYGLDEAQKLQPIPSNLQYEIQNAELMKEIKEKDLERENLINLIYTSKRKYLRGYEKVTNAKIVGDLLKWSQHENKNKNKKISNLEKELEKCMKLQNANDSVTNKILELQNQNEKYIEMLNNKDVEIKNLQNRLEMTIKTQEQFWNSNQEKLNKKNERIETNIEEDTSLQQTSNDMYMKKFPKHNNEKVILTNPSLSFSPNSKVLEKLRNFETKKYL